MGFLISWFLGFLLLSITGIIMWTIFNIGMFVIERINPILGVLIFMAMASLLITIFTYFGL